MSQYPNPQQSQFPVPPTGYPPYAYPTGQTPIDPMAAARRASMLMFILGGLTIFMGLCMGAFAFMDLEHLAAQGGRPLPPLPQGMSWTVVAGVFGVIALLAGGMQLVVAGFVRRATTTPIVFGIVMSGLLLLYFLVNTFYGFTKGQPDAGVLSLMAFSIYALQLYFLMQALRNIPILKQMQAAYQAQYWQYVQQQQAYQSSQPSAGGTGIYNQTAYNAPPAVSPQPPQSQSGWQWPAPPPPPPNLSLPQNPQNLGETHGQGSQQ